MKKTKPKKARSKTPSPKARNTKGPTNAQLEEMMKKNKPPQSWYDEDHSGLFAC
jgi:hypothetical protein